MKMINENENENENEMKMKIKQLHKNFMNSNQV